MATALTMAPAVRFHLSLNVSDLGRSVAFYRVLFGTEPAKVRHDYAKFELDDPPLVMSLEPTPRQTGGPLNHLGFRLPDSAALVAMQERIERAGIRSRREEGVECCYARQTKFWVHDPDKTLWEIYTLDEDIDHRGIGQSLEEMIPEGTNGHVEPVVWEHRMSEPVPTTIPLADASADEVRLRGSLNLSLPVAVQERLVMEAHRVLKPGGRLFVHVLVGDQVVTAPQLSGPAAAVQHVPVQSEPIQLLQKAGLRGVRMEKFDAKPCFQRQGVDMRELRLEGWKSSAEQNNTVKVLYKGPFRQITDDSGRVYVRGEWVEVPACIGEALQQGETAEVFLVVS